MTAPFTAPVNKYNFIYPNNSYSVPTTMANQSVSIMTFNGGSSVNEVVTTTDGLGRPIVVQKLEGPSSSNWDSVQTKYDYMDRPDAVSLPYVTTTESGAAGTEFTTTTYDPLSRKSEIADGGGGTVAYAYNGNDVLQTLGPAPGSEDAKIKQFERDGLGRLSSVCEVVTQTGAGTPTPGSGTCSQVYTANGYWTKYTHNALGQITGVTQNAQTTPTESRSFAFDWLGRMTSETNPESGTTSYTFDTNGTCGTSSGDLVMREDAHGNYTCYAYDDNHRVTEISYPSGPNSSATPTKYFVYDAATYSGTPMANAEGRLARAYTGSGPTTDLYFSYTPLGQAAETWQASPHSDGYYTTTATYYGNGALDTLAAPGAPTITYAVDGQGRPTTVSAGSGQDPVTAATYSVLGLTALTLGSGDGDAYTYDADTGRMTQYQFTVDSATDTGALSWNKNGTLASLGITDNISGTGDTQSCGYTHDDLGRIWTANCGSAWNQTFSIDPFGNVAKTASVGTSFSADFNVENQISTVGGVSASYDADGNLLNDPTQGSSTVNAYDSEGKAVTLESIGVTYDALGRAVEAAVTGGPYEFMYGPSGSKLAVMSGSSGTTSVATSIPLPGGGDAVYTGGTLEFYRHADHLGSSRLASTPSQTLYSSTAYAPYGEAYDEEGTADRSFTGQKQQISSASGGQYDFLMRELSSTQSRWWTPDPAGVAAADPNNPQSWNRYAYVGGSPMEATDPLGLFYVTPPLGCFYDPDEDGDLYCLPPPAPPPNPPSNPPGGGGGGGGSQITTKTPQGRVCSNYSSQVNFLAQNLAGATAAAATINTNPANLLGLAAYESNYGHNGPTYYANNPLGLSPGFPMSGPAWYDQANGNSYSSFTSNAQAFASFTASSWGAREFGAATAADFAAQLDPSSGPHYSNDAEIDPAQYIKDVEGSILTIADLLSCIH